MASLKDPYCVLAGGVLEIAVCQKSGHELAYDLNKFGSDIFDESSIYCHLCWRSTVNLFHSHGKYILGMEPLSEVGGAYQLLENVKLLMTRDIIKLVLLRLQISDVG